MPKAKDLFRMEVTETTNADLRVITATISAPVQEFMLADLLRKRGVLSPPETALKQSLREAIQRHLDGAEALIASLVPGPAKTNGNGKGKTLIGVEGAGKAHETEMTAEPVLWNENSTREEPEWAISGLREGAFRNGEPSQWEVPGDR
jgi:hypothetical protein